MAHLSRAEVTTIEPEISPRYRRDIAERSPYLRRAEVSPVEPYVDARLRITYQALEPASDDRQNDVDGAADAGLVEDDENRRQK